MSHLPRHRLRHWAFAALLAVFALCIAPTLSRVLAQVQGGSPWQQLCSAASGLSQARTGSFSSEASREGPGPSSGQMGDHCALCLLASAAAAPPPEITPWHPASALRERLASSAQALTALAPPLWRPSQPRAPPDLA